MQTQNEVVGFIDGARAELAFALRAAPRALPRVVGVAGPKSSGKSTVVDYLARKHGYGQTALAAPLKALCVATFAPMGLTTREAFGASAAREAPLLGACDPSIRAAVWSAVDGAESLGTAEAFGSFFDAPGAPPNARPRIAREAFAREVGAILSEARQGRRVSVREVLQRIGTDIGRGLWRGVWVHATLEAIARGAFGANVAISDVRFADEARALQSCGGVAWALHRPGTEPPPGSHASEPTASEFAGVADISLPNNGTLADLFANVELALESAHGAN